MNGISATVTCGAGSERHNHDLDYRANLKHVHAMQNGVIELVPYVDYQQKINELVKPFIDEYNQNVDERYAQAWERYKAGEIKSKPKKRDYQKMGYDYYADHKDDVIKNPNTNKNEEVPMFRSMIWGLGDKSDRDNQVITEAQAIDVFQKTIEDFRERFPYFHILGASMHLDEEGFYHLHLDYKPIMPADFSRGLQVTVSQDAVLEKMGYEPEQSIINERDKAPIRFNAMRNEIYRVVEKNLLKHDLRLIYNVSKIKEPDKDSSTNQRKEIWQATRDAAATLQNEKNAILDILAKDEVSDQDVKSALNSFEKVNKTLTDAEHSVKFRGFGMASIPFKIFDQLKSVLSDFKQVFAHLVHQVRDLTERLDRSEEQVEDLQAKVDMYEPYYHSDSMHQIENAHLRNEVDRLEKKTKKQEEFIARHLSSNDVNQKDVEKDIELS